MKTQANTKFLEHIDLLKNKGVSYSRVERVLGWSRGKVINIKRGTSSVTYEELKRLESIYPELKPQEEQRQPEQNSDLEERVGVLERQLMKVLDENEKQRAELEQLKAIIDERRDGLKERAKAALKAQEMYEMLNRIEELEKKVK